MNCAFSKFAILAGISFCGFFFGPNSAQADAFLFRFGDVFSGDGPTSLSRPWVDTMVRDISPGVVQITISNLTLSGSENLDEFYLNLNTNLNPVNLSLAIVGGSGGFDAPAFSKGVNLFKADGDGYYDLLFSFATGGSDSNRFGAGEYFVFNLSGIATLSAMDFVYNSAPGGGHGPFYAATHVQRIGQNADKSGWIAPIDNQIVLIPEPTPQMLALVSTGVWFCIRRARFPKANR